MSDRMTPYGGAILSRVTEAVRRRYAHGPEILAHCQRIGRQFGLYDDALFHTEITGLAWDETRALDHRDQPR
jgi:hypothetical protein